MEEQVNEVSASEPWCTVEDSIWIHAAPERVFAALVDAGELVRWWPMAAESDPKPGGRLVLTWFSGGTLTTTFETFAPGGEVAFAFHDEHVRLTLRTERDGSRVTVIHRCRTEGAVHVAGAWGFLKANLKSAIEHGIDLRTPD